jgi:hypothetical protein
MPDDILPENPPPATTPSAAPAQQPTAAASPLDLPEVKAAIAAAETKAAEHARNATWKQARETIERKSAGKTPNAELPASAPPATATAPAIGSSRAYERAVAAFDFSDEALTLLDADFDRERPADPRAFVEARATAFRTPRRGTATPPTPNTTPAPAASATAAAPTAAAPVTGNGAPASVSTVTADTPILSMSVSDRVALQAKIGPAKYTERYFAELQGKSAAVR